MNVSTDVVHQIQPGVFTYKSFTILSNFESANLDRVTYVCKQTPGFGAMICKL